MSYLTTVEKARYGDIRRQGFLTGDRSLSRLLKELQSKGFIKKESLPTYPVSTNYSLTDKGRQIAEYLINLRKLLVE